MYMRLFQIKIKAELFTAYRKFYDEKVIPEFQNMTGCLYATLVQSAQHRDECISLTMWDTPAHAEALEENPVYQRLIEEERGYLAESSEWKVQLSKDLKVEYAPLPEEPIVNVYNVAARADEQTTSEGSRPLFLRIFSVKIRPGKLEELRKIYDEEIIPAFKSVKGCRYAYLTQSTKEENEVVSVTIWDTKEDAVNFENSGLYKQLIEKAKQTFSDLYQWKMGLQKEFAGQVTTSEDVKVEHYTIVTGKRFR